MTTRRRSQTERTEQTQNALITSTVELLMERGMQGTNVQEICKRAQVTTGAIQHHFGSKTGLMAEVTKALYAPFLATPAPTHGPDVPLEERVRLLVDHYWLIYIDARYFALTEVVMSARNEPVLSKLVSTYSAQQEQTLEQTLSEGFKDIGQPLPYLVESFRFMTDYLRGYATRRQFWTYVGYVATEAATDRAALAYARRLLLHHFTHRVPSSSE